MSSDPCSRASSQFARGDTKGALKNIQLCQKSLKKNIRKAKDGTQTIEQLKLNLSKAYFFEGQVHYSEGKMGKARSAFTQALKNIEQIEENQEILALKAQQHYSLGITYLAKNQISESLKLITLAKNEYIAAKKFESGLEILFRLATIYKKLGEFGTAIEFLQEIPDYKRQIKDKKERYSIIGKSKLELAKIYRIIEYDRAEKELKSARKEFSKAKDNHGLVECLVEMASLYENKNQENSHELLLEAKDLALTMDSPSTKGLVFTKLGIASLKQGKFEEGKELLVKGLKYRTEAGDKLGTADTLVELSRISLITSRNSDDLENAEKFASQALELYEENNHKYGMANSLELLSSINTKLGNLSIAKKQINKGKKIFADYDDKNGEGRMMTQLGLILDQQSNHVEAIVVLEKAIELFEQTSNDQGKAEALHILAMQHKANPEKAITLLKQSRELYSSIIGEDKHLGIILKSIDSTIERLQQN